MINKLFGKSEKKKGGDTIESPMSNENRVPPTPTAEDAKSLANRLTLAKKQELDRRLTALNIELRPLLMKHGFAISAEPFIENGQIQARPLVVDNPQV